MRWVCVKGGIVGNVIVPGDSEIRPYLENLFDQVVDLEDDTLPIEVGWGYDGTNFYDPENPPE